MALPMHRSLPLFACLIPMMIAEVHASPAGALAVEKKWDIAMTKWSLETQEATTPEARAKAMNSRPDATPYAKEMWQNIGTSLQEDWTIEPAAWFLRATPGLRSSNPDGTTSLTFAAEIETIRKTVETTHVNSPKLIPMCMAFVASQDPRALAFLEKVQASNPDTKVQGVAALGAAMILKGLGDDGDIMRKRLTYLRKAIIQSSDIDLGGTSVAKLAEDELYVIRFLTKGRIAPDLAGSDSGGAPMKLSNFNGKVVMLLFWSSTMIEADRVAAMTNDLMLKHQGKPFVVVGVNQDPLAKLRSLEGAQESPVMWKSFSDPTKELAGQYRVGTWPLVYVLDGDRRISYAGPPGSFAEATVDALLAPKAPGAK